MWTIAGGIILAIVGLFLLLFGVGMISKLFPSRKYSPPRFPLKIDPPDLGRDPPSHW
jgi:hypothetical protein